MSHLELRKAALADHEVLNEIKRAASLVSDEYRKSLLANPNLLMVSEDRIRSGQVIVAEENGQVVGLADISIREVGLELQGLFVEPSKWKRGVGRLLVEGAVEHFGKEAATKSLHVVASPDARDFYLACGFEVVGDTSTRFGPAIVMKRGT